LENPYFSAQERQIRESKIAANELSRVKSMSQLNHAFITRIESDPKLLIAVSPDKEIETIDGSCPIDLMDRVNFSNRVPRAVQHKKFQLNSPYLADFGRDQGSIKFFCDMNHHSTKKSIIEKSPSLQVKHGKKIALNK